MSRSVLIECPECERAYEVDRAIIGKRILCARCDARILAKEVSRASGGAAVHPEMYVGKGNHWGPIIPQHIEMVQNTLLADGEIIEAIVSGRAKSVSTKSDGFFRIFEDPETNKGGNVLKHYLVLTDRRVFFWARGVFKSSTQSLEFGDIKGVEQQNGFIYGGLVLNAHGRAINFTEMNKPEAEVVANLIRARLRARQSETGLPRGDRASDPVGQLESLAAMLEKGLITQAEFDAKKQDLLDRL